MREGTFILVLLAIIVPWMALMFILSLTGIHL